MLEALVLLKSIIAKAQICKLEDEKPNMANAGETVENIELKEVESTCALEEETDKWLTENANRTPVIALAGRSGVGKSTLVNNILGLTDENAATAAHDGNATTMSVTRYTCNTANDKVTIDIIDTPGFGSFGVNKSAILRDLEEKSQGKADLLLYCASLQPCGRIGEADLDTVKTLTRAFNKKIWKRAILVLTFANEVLETDGTHFERLVENYASNFELCLSNVGVPTKVASGLSPRVAIGPADNEIRAIPAGFDVQAPLGNDQDWVGTIHKEILDKVHVDALPQLLLINRRQAKVSSIIKSITGGAAAGVVVGAGIGAGIGGILVGVPTLGVGAPIGIGVGTAAGAFIGSVSSATVVSVIHNRVIPAIRKRVMLRKREKQYRRMESNDVDLETSTDSSASAFYDVPADLDIAIEEEKWYFGELKRKLAEGKCTANGDYLVRYSDTRKTYVLTCRWNDRGRHFPIHEIINEDDLAAPPQYHIGPKRFPSIRKLIDHHVDQEAPLTEKSQVKITKAVTRYGNIKLSDMRMGEKIGKGAFGDVYEARFISTQENFKIAVKTCRSSDLQERDQFLQEAEAMSKYNHPNIVRLIGLCEDIARKQTYIVMEFMHGGSFLNFLRKKGNYQTKSKLCKMCNDACEGMKYLESVNCIHRDLAARNCLVGENDIVKISDFGMSRTREGGVYILSGPRQLPIKWTAPEALNSGHYTSASDVWSFGILLWEAFSCGSIPYPGMDNQKTRTQIELGDRMEIPVDCPQEVYGIMQQCWQYDPDERPDFSLLLVMLTQAEENIV